MKTMTVVTSLVAAAACLIGSGNGRAAAAEEAPVQSRIESIGLFKNGLAVVRRTVELPGPGLYRLDSTPTPVHGTFWIESANPIAARVTWREVDGPLAAAPAAANSAGGAIDFQQELAGRNVTIHFRESGIPPVTGKVVEIGTLKPQPAAAWNRGEDHRHGIAANSSPGRFLIVETDNGRIYADTSIIAYVAVQGAINTVKRRTPVLLLDHQGKSAGEGDAAGPVAVIVSYLTRGIAWAPSYRINLDDSQKLTVEQQAVIKNELEEFADVELQLISGFPSVQFGHVQSPISLDTTWANFFNQLNQRMSSQHGVLGNAAMNQQAVYYGPGDSDIDLSAIPAGEGVDLHYQSIGPRTMAVDEALALPIAKAQADYERIVEWIVPDTRDAEGRYVRDHHRDNDPDRYQDAAWDAVRFKNPLPFAMTTAPATIMANGRFNGQRMSYWVNAGEQTTIQVTKALSLRTRAVEQEQQDQERQVAWIGGNDYRKTAVSGELTMSNHRQEPIKLILRRQFSGELVAADGEPRTMLREEGVYSVNRRNELTWSLELQPGQTMNLKYSYTVLVDM